MHEKEKHQWERKQKTREVLEKTDNESSGGHFMCGFDCLRCCTATTPSARKVQEMSSWCGSYHGRDLSLTKTYTEEE